MKAVRFDAYGPVDVLEVRDVADPQPARREIAGVAAATFPLERVRDADRALAGEHPLGKIALRP